MLEGTKTFLGSIQEVYINFAIDIVSFLSKAVLAILVIALGWYIAKYVKTFVEKILNTIDLDKALSIIKFDEFVAKAGYKLDSSRVVGELARWAVLSIAIVAGLKIVGFNDAIDFIKQIISSGLLIITSIVIVALSVLAANFLAGLASGIIGSVDKNYKNIAGKIVKVVVYFFTTIFVLNLFPVTRGLVNYIDFILIAFLFGSSVAFGIAFGLGGKDLAKERLEKIKSKK